MIATKSLLALAFSALAVVHAAPTTVEPRSGSTACRPSINRPNSSLCNAWGAITDDNSMPFIRSGALSLQECVESCATDRSCNTFFWEAGTCATYSGVLSRDNFAYNSNGGFWNDIHCFECSTADPVLALDFEHGDINNWSITDDVEDNYACDIQTPHSFTKAMTHAFRILEIEDTGSATINYMPDIPVEVGTYRIGFTAKNNFQTNPTSSTKWEFVKVIVAGSGRDFYHGPASGVALGLSWYQFEMEFEVADGQEGVAHLSFAMSASGFSLDYYLDDIYIVKA